MNRPPGPFRPSSRSDPTISREVSTDGLVRDEGAVRVALIPRSLAAAPFGHRGGTDGQTAVGRRAVRTAGASAAEVPDVVARVLGLRPVEVRGPLIETRTRDGVGVLS